MTIDELRRKIEELNELCEEESTRLTAIAEGIEMVNNAHKMKEAICLLQQQIAGYCISMKQLDDGDETILFKQAVLIYNLDIQLDHIIWEKYPSYSECLSVKTSYLQNRIWEVLDTCNPNN